jgi:hypothetical protein
MAVLSKKTLALDLLPAAERKSSTTLLLDDADS